MTDAPHRPNADASTAGPPLVAVGGGNMASAIIAGSIDAGVAAAERWLVVEPDADRRAAHADRGCRVSASLAEAETDISADAAVLLAVKPQVLPAVEADLRRLVAAAPAGRLVISIMAGVPIARLAGAAGPGSRIVRTMPNTPARVGRGITAIAAAADATDADRALARSLFDAVGEVVELGEELLDAFTGVAGSGPAYVFHLCEAMAAGAEAVGLPPAEAERIARATVAGAGALLDASDESAAALREAVTSPGGTTAAGLQALDEGRFVHLIAAAVEAARDRGRELGEA